MMRDLYDRQRLLRDALLPPALVYGNPAYLRPLVGAPVIGGTYLHLMAFDLARAEDGRWWVIGQGWVKTKDLTQGTCLRTSTGFTSIQKMKDGLSEVTYNLVVDSDHTYFVGKSRLLSFDASEAIPTFQKVPGIQE